MIFSLVVNKLIKIAIFVLSSILVMMPGTVVAGLFGYKEKLRSNLEIFPQWLSVLERHISHNAPEGNCDSRLIDSCHVANWKSFLSGIKKLTKFEQIQKVNKYANQHAYILDIENYGVEDYWAIPKEFLYNNGDCEDYAITKMLSLKALGFNNDEMRLVVLQDTNLSIAHAVLAVKYKNDFYIMDNQVSEVVSHKHILHYVPIYSVNEKSWWMYLPSDNK